MFKCKYSDGKGYCYWQKRVVDKPECMNKCSLSIKCDKAVKDANGNCLGYTSELNENEPCEICNSCDKLNIYAS